MGQENKTGPFGLEGLFDQTTTSAEALEREVIGPEIEGSEYQFEDVVGIAAGTIKAGRGPQISVLCLTTRGRRESQDPALKSAYQTLFGKLSGESSILDLGAELQKGNKIIEKFQYSELARSYSDLGCPDGKKRIIVQYVGDTTDKTFERR